MAKQPKNDSNRERGQAIVFFTIFLLIMGMFLGLAVDGARTYLMRARLAKIVDASTLAGAKAMAVAENDTEATQNATAIACDAARVNGLTAVGDPGTCPPNINVDVATVTDPDTGDDRLRITVTGTDAGKTVLLKLGSFFGCGDLCKNINVGALAAAEYSSAGGAPVVPLGVRAAGFGAIDPDIEWANPNKIGPSGPDVCYGQFTNCPKEQFTPGETNGDIIYLGSYGKGTKMGVSLVLDILHDPDNPTGALENYIQVLKGNRPMLPVSIGQEFYVIQEGRTNHATHVDDRLHKNNEADTLVIVPIVATKETIRDGTAKCSPNVKVSDLSAGDSRDEDGKLSGKIVICDFIAVQLLGTEDVSADETEGTDSTGDKAKHLFGRVIKEAIVGPAGAASGNVASPSVVIPYLIL